MTKFLKRQSVRADSTQPNFASLIPESTRSETASLSTTIRNGYLPTRSDDVIVASGRGFARRTFLAGAAALATGTLLPARAASEPVVIGVTTALSTVSGAAMAEGVKLALRELGESTGRRVRVVVLDDNGDPKRTFANAQQLLDGERPICLAACASGACAKAISSLLASARVPLVGVASGAEDLREGANRWLYHTRAGRGVEAAAIVSQLDSIGVARIAVVHSNNTFGDEGRDGARMELSRLGIRPEAMLPVQEGGRDVAAVLAELEKTNAQAVIVISDSTALVALVRGLRARSQHCRVIAVSESSSDYCLRQLGGDARGLGFSEVFPNPTRTAIPLVREYQAALKRAGSTFEKSYAGLEGYVDGRVIGWALRRIDRGVASSFAGVLENSDIDIGGFRLRYSTADKRGTAFVEMVVVSDDGRLTS